MSVERSGSGTVGSATRLKLWQLVFSMSAVQLVDGVGMLMLVCMLLT